MQYLIRESKKSDSYDIMHVVTLAWNETYKGIVPDAFLNELKQNEMERAQNHYNEFDKDINKELVLEVDNKIVGFVRYGKSEDKNFTNCGEIIALYILKKYHGYGYGKELVKEAKSRLKNMGFNSMIIACLKGNPSNEFYKHIGGKYVKDRLFVRLNLQENVYFFDI